MQKNSCVQGFIVSFKLNFFLQCLSIYICRWYVTESSMWVFDNCHCVWVHSLAVRWYYYFHVVLFVFQFENQIFNSSSWPTVFVVLFVLNLILFVARVNRKIKRYFICILFLGGLFKFLFLFFICLSFVSSLYIFNSVCYWVILFWQ